MQKKNNQPPILRIPNPFHESAKTRLVHMSVINQKSQINQATISTFADIFTGLFFDDICGFYSDAKDLLPIYENFAAFYEKEDYQHMYLYFSIQYDYIRKPLPEAVWWLAGNSEVVKEFMTLFIVRFKKIMTEADFLAANGGDN